MVVEGTVLAVTRRKIGEREVRNVDVEGLELGISDDQIDDPLEGSRIRARVYIHWISSSKGNFCVRDVKAWDLVK